LAEKHVLNQKLLREFHAQPGQDVLACFKHHDTNKIFTLAKNMCNYIFCKGKLELRKKTIFLPSTCTNSSQRQKPEAEGSSSLHHERILRKSSWSASL
jgi:hypothetical protein